MIATDRGWDGNYLGPNSCSRDGEVNLHCRLCRAEDSDDTNGITRDKNAVRAVKRRRMLSYNRMRAVALFGGLGGGKSREDVVRREELSLTARLNARGKAGEVI
jgi:hypothetical protein